MPKFKVGDEVRVISDCKSKGKIGVVTTCTYFTITVMFGAGPWGVGFSPNSLELVTDKKVEEKQKELKLGIFTEDKPNFTSDYQFSEDVMFVYGYSPEHCMEIHQKAISNGEIGAYQYLIFDNKKYEISTKTVLYISKEI